ncbi:MAG: ArsR family transcriptional regulator [Candidatus Thorarchaeota archaeon]
MGNDDGLAKIFFELASENRLGILKELRSSMLKTQDIARKMDVTPTEAVRQLQRLSDAGLIQRQPDGTYLISPFGKLVLQLSSSIEFISHHQDYFSNHDIFQLPIQLVNRIGEVSNANLVMDTIENLNTGQRIMMDATEFAYGIAEGHIPELMGPIMDKKIREGFQIKMLIPTSMLTKNKLPPNVEIRGLSEIPLGMVLTESAAVVTFRLVNGKFGYAGFSGTNPMFLDWVRDLFLYYWEEAR